MQKILKRNIQKEFRNDRTRRLVTCHEIFHFWDFHYIHVCAVNVLIAIHKVSTTAGNAGKAGK